MILIPAIDIRDGRAVRLEQGDFARETVYVHDPLEAALGFQAEGAQLLHVVDLDGARAGAPVNLHHLGRIASGTGLPVQYGGGMRSLAAVHQALEAGADRVVIGTAAYRDPGLLEAALRRWGARVAVAVDVRTGKVSVAGWTQATGARPEEAIEAMQAQGVERFLYTNADRDGSLEGPDPQEVKRIAAAVRRHLLYSGGIGSLDDLAALRSLRLANLEGVISGKALYAGRFTLSEGQAVLAGGGLALDPAPGPGEGSGGPWRSSEGQPVRKV